MSEGNEKEIKFYIEAIPLNFEIKIIKIKNIFGNFRINIFLWFFKWDSKSNL